MEVAGVECIITDMFIQLLMVVCHGMNHIRIMEILYDVFFINDSTGWAVGEYSTVVYTIDQGETWLFSSIPPLGQILRAVQFIDEDNGCIAGESTNETGIIFKSYDGGINWVQKLVTLSHL